MYFPIIDMLEKSARDLCCWFFSTCLFSTRELRLETKRFFETGQTSIRYFGWLNVPRMKALYPGRWKIVLADFAGAYVRLLLLGALVALLIARSLEIF